MSFPKSESFRIITPLSLKAAMETIRSFTKTSDGKTKGRKLYAGSINTNSFEITRNTQRSKYKSLLPLIPFLKFMPGFLRGEVHGYDKETIVDVVIQSEEVINGFHRLTWMLIKISAIIIFILGVLVISILFLLEPVWSFDLRSVDRVKIGEGLGVLIGIWIAASMIFLAFDYFSVARYKKRYAEIAAFEKREFTELLKGKLQKVH